MESSRHLSSGTRRYPPAAADMSATTHVMTVRCRLEHGMWVLRQGKPRPSVESQGEGCSALGKAQQLVRTDASAAVGFVGVEARVGIGALIVQDEGVHTGRYEGAQGWLTCRMWHSPQHQQDGQATSPANRYVQALDTPNAPSVAPCSQPAAALCWQLCWHPAVCSPQNSVMSGS